MPTKYFNFYREKPPALAKAEDEARKALSDYFRQEHGTQKTVSDITGIPQSMLSRMAGRKPSSIAFEAAVAIEVATKGALKVELLCPSRVELLKDFLLARLKEK